MNQVLRGVASNNRNRWRRRPGVILVLTALLLIFMLAMVALAVDLGYIAMSRTELQKSVDSAALAAAGEMVVKGETLAKDEALKYVALNQGGGRKVSKSNVIVDFGDWDTGTRTFTVSSSDNNAVRVTATTDKQSLFFGAALGKKTFDTKASAVAVYKPRDIALVLDYSGSMCFDSQFQNIALMSQNDIEANLKEIYQELGSPVYGNLKFKPVAYGNSNTSTSKVLSNFGLTKVAYPYPGGSWSEYVDYVQTDWYIQAAGYQNEYGYLTWLNYTLARHNSATDTPGLWKVSEQPVTALKDAVDAFFAYLTAYATDDRVALSIYTSSDGTATLEHRLTKNYSLIAQTCRQRQAGHYVGGTNISAGMNKGRIELQNNSRPGAVKMMVVMTDGIVNMPTGIISTDKARVITEAYACKAAKIPVMTISLGARADIALMQQVAVITGGAAFIVPGGQKIALVEKQLEAVFAQVAGDRPLQLVQ